jgi:hypothetical protein
MRINQDGNNITIDTPYNPAFVERLRAVGAKWDPACKTWRTDARNIEAVRAAMRDAYGCDDRPAELVSVRVTLTTGLRAWCGPITLFGRTVASASGRDSGARVGDGVCFEEGCPESGGSVKNWRTIIPAGSIFVVHDVPRAAIEQRIDWQEDWGTAEIITTPAVPDRAALAEERAGLLKRVAEIDRALDGSK